MSKPEQVYWLNDHQYVAHDIHKEDYEATLQVSGGAEVTVIMNDGNDHEIPNWTKDYFEGVPPYDTMPSLGQTLRLDVISVEPALKVVFGRGRELLRERLRARQPIVAALDGR